MPARLKPARRSPAVRIAAALLLAAAATPAAADWMGDSLDARYGRRLVQETFSIVGPEVSDPDMRFAGNNLACASCHAVAGTRPDALPLTRAYSAYPAYSARSGKVETIENRVNDCFERSMNGRPLPLEGREMQAIVAYLRFLDAEAPDFQQPDPAERPPLPELARPADPARGAGFFAERCAGCHGADGAGVRVGAPGDALGYLHPPLWGPDSFNTGAGMARLTMLANFAHDAMPEDAYASPPPTPPDVAWDIAAFVLSHPRPVFHGAPADYPKPEEKHADTPYGPYADGFDEPAHRLGPFAPIRAALDALRAGSD
jgi:thiosulfate dehydrogenase